MISEKENKPNICDAARVTSGISQLIVFIYYQNILSSDEEENKTETLASLALNEQSKCSLGLGP